MPILRHIHIIYHKTYIYPSLVPSALHLSSESQQPHRIDACFYELSSNEGFTTAKLRIIAPKKWLHRVYLTWPTRQKQFDSIGQRGERSRKKSRGKRRRQWRLSEASAGYKKEKCVWKTTTRAAKAEGKSVAKGADSRDASRGGWGSADSEEGKAAW